VENSITSNLGVKPTSTQGNDPEVAIIRNKFPKLQIISIGNGLFNRNTEDEYLDISQAISSLDVVIDVLGTVSDPSHEEFDPNWEVVALIFICAFLGVSIGFFGFYLSHRFSSSSRIVEQESDSTTETKEKKTKPEKKKKSKKPEKAKNKKEKENSSSSSSSSSGSESSKKGQYVHSRPPETVEIDLTESESN
jgi:hypothetical protein